MPRIPAPLPQHLELLAWLRSNEPEVWEYFTDEARQSEYADQLRLALLKDHYRIDNEGHPEIMSEVEAAKIALGLDVPVHVYQSQNGVSANAQLCFLPGEAYLVFSGSITSLLTKDELRAVIGHELAHYFLWAQDNGDFFRADRILESSSDHPLAHPSHVQSARLWRLATEFYADRGALVAANDLHTAVSALVKTATGMAQVSASSYLAQAAEIFSKGKQRTSEFSHPETFMRAHALALWHQNDPKMDETISSMLDLDDGLDTLTLLQQTELTQTTNQFLREFLSPSWIQTDAVLAHARLFFPDFKPALTPDPAHPASLSSRPAPVRNYLGQLMIDFCAADPDLNDEPMIHALIWAGQMEMLGMFEKLLARDLKIKARELKKLKEQAAARKSNQTPAS